MKEHQQLAIEEREKQIALKMAEDKKKNEKERKRKEKEKKRLKKLTNPNKISFGDEEEICVVPKRKRLGKDLSVDTSFLPDDGKDEREREAREGLRQEWLRQQEKLKNQTLDFEYVYWDGSPHQR